MRSRSFARRRNGRSGGFTKANEAAQEDADASFWPTALNVVLALFPSDVIAVIQTTMIIDIITAYSTAVGPSSRRQNSATHRFSFINMVIPPAGGEGVPAIPMSQGTCGLQ